MADTCGGEFFIHLADGSVEPAVTTTVTSGDGPWFYIAATSVYARLAQAERWGTATRPIFGLLWDVWSQQETEA